MKTLFKFELYCDDEATTLYAWAEAAPQTCPHNGEHSIDTSKTKVVDKITDESIVARIAEESVDADTGGRFQTQSFEIDVPASSDPAPLDISWPFPVSMLAAQFAARAESIGDSIEAQIAPDTVVGFLDVDAAIGDNVFTVGDTVLANAKLGYWLKLDDEDVGRITKIDTITKQITTENALVAAKLTGVMAKLTVKMIPALFINSERPYRLGISKIGGSYLKTSTIVRVLYKNTTGTAKKFSFVTEMLY